MSTFNQGDWGPEPPDLNKIVAWTIVGFLAIFVYYILFNPISWR
jgi:hypothetical protein